MSDLSPLRPVLGPAFNADRSIPAIPPDPDRPPRLDVEVALIATDDDSWTATFAVPAYDLATHNLLAEVRCYLVASGHGRPGSAADYVASSYAFASWDLRESRGGFNLVLPLPECDPASYVGQTVLMFQDDAKEPPTLPSDEPETPVDEPPASEGDQPD